MAHPRSNNPKGAALRRLMLGAIGVVFGDIGTSPLYTMREAFSPEHFIKLTEMNVLGVLSMIIWSLIIVVGIKYISFVMRADNHGEGGILALTTLAQRAAKKWSSSILIIGLIGASLFYGDGVITPAISVLSAIEGLVVATPHFSPYIVPITIVILVILFGSQRSGSGTLGKLFGPVMCVWFLTLGGLGLYQIVQNPDVIWAFSPFYALHFFMDNGLIGFMLLGTVALCITGVEAIYTDMGHFGIKPIRMLWFYFILPCLLLNYMGQGALILRLPEAIENPFYQMAPRSLLYPLVFLATISTVIASQAMISGAFTMTEQAIQLGLLPRLKIIHTSAKHIGQVYIPSLNKMLFIGVILLVLWYGSSSALASAYGIAVISTMVMTSTLAFIVVWKLWHWPLWRTLLLLTPLIVFDLVYFLATLTKLSHGPQAWIPVIMGITIFTIMTTWKDGKILKDTNATQGHELMSSLVKKVKNRDIPRIDGMAIYMTRSIDHVPPTLALNLKHYHAIHKQVLLARVKTLDVPRVMEKDRMDIFKLSNNIACVTLYYGFMQHPNVPRDLKLIKKHGLDWDIKQATYFMNRIRVVPTPGSGMWLWREKLYAMMHRNAAAAGDHFKLPPQKVLEIGSPIKI